MMGSLISLTANNWLTVWLGLELNLMSFLPLITLNKSSQETESAIKYFLVQALGSGFVLLGGLTQTLNSSNYFILFIMIGLVLKLGASPLHFWFPVVMSGMNWINCLVLATWQKISPLFLLLTISSSLFKPLASISALSAIVGGLMGMNQTNLRPLLAYSSIGHMGWLILLTQASMGMLIIYFLVYISISAPLFLIFHLIFKERLSQNSPLQNWPKNQLILTGILILSLGGIPPLTGFMAKWLAIQYATPLAPLATTLLVIGSLLSLYYYLMLFFSIIISPAKELNQNSSWSSLLSPLTTLLMLPATIGIVLIPLL
uniref:NADH-ubiquinone oxidoreductase chain 2 n=1 Tax=Magelona mirabilis TaxID=46598 RepID=A0A0S2N0H4_9ANNE|nr:NADH dehydrogenase subunit 2 [Magelona mirabilis]ALO81685.1 NADH dehydrogenase subunit 2 [Magelona mirabilis]